MDQVKQQVWIAIGLVDQYGDILRRYDEAFLEQNEAECHVLRGEVERVYPSIWEHLDGAAKLTAGSGRAIDAYAQIRAHPELVTTNALASVDPHTLRQNQEGIDLARAAARALQHAWPELDWTPPATPDVDLRGGFFGRLLRKILR
ncbi:MAG: hypothetical protein ACKV2T_05190 [Kofleriaceae bacterium]